MKTLLRELRALAAAVVFFTRLPLPGVRLTSADMGLAVTYLPVCGWLVGGWAALVYWVAAGWWPPLVASLLSLGATLVLTGALHEDGWADVCDGLGGGNTRERSLAIMQDSHIGAFGVIGLIVVLGLKITLLPALGGTHFIFIVLVAHSLSRASATALMAGLPYARTEGTPSKSRGMVCTFSPTRLVGVVVLGLMPLAGLPKVAWLVVPVVIVTHLAYRAWLRQRLGGYTGDCLGACLVGTEVLIYLTLIAVL